ncbi:MAG: hypothetical protein ACFUZC_09700 [Chthoniobacteraceae bacterium]
MKLPRIPFVPSLVIWIINTISVFALRESLNDLYRGSRWKPSMENPVWHYLPLAVVLILLGLMPLFRDATKYRTAYRLLNLTCALLGVVFFYRWWLQLVLDITAI